MAAPNFVPYTDPKPESAKDAPVPELPNPLLESGTRLPRPWIRQLPSRLIAVPLHEVDPHYANQNTFVLVTKSHVLRRYTAQPVLWCLGPSSPVRLFFIRLSTHYAFNLLLNLAVLINCILLITSGEPLAIEIMWYIFLSLYILEALVKILSLGFLMGPFTYLRNGWNILDMLVILLWVFGLIFGFQFYGLRIFRLIKILGLFSGYKPLVRTFEESLKNMGNVLIVLLVFVAFYSILGMELFSGAFRHKCIYRYNYTEDIPYVDYIHNPENWLEHKNSYPECGNHSGAVSCPDSYDCIYIDDPKANPNYGFTNFDTYGFSLLSTTQLVMGDFWEDQYYTVLSTTGPLMIVFFFLPLLSLLYLTGLMIGVVYAEYSQAVIIQRTWEEENKEDPPAEQDDPELNVTGDIEKKENDASVELYNMDESENKRETTKEDETYEDADLLLQAQIKALLIKALKALCLWICCWCCEKTAKKFRDFVFHPYIQFFFHLCIVLNTIFLALEGDDMSYDFANFIYRGHVIFSSIFLAEIVLTITALGPKDYLKSCTNILDLIVVFLAFLGIFVETLTGFTALLAFRIFRVLPKLPLGREYSRLLFILWRLLGPFRRMVLFHLVLLLGLAFIGEDIVCTLCFETMDEPIPRFNFVDLWHSLLAVFRIFCEEWVEMLWDCMHVGGLLCVPFFLVAAMVLHLVVFNMFVSIALHEFIDASKEFEYASSYCKDTKFGRICSLMEEKLVAVKNALCCKNVNKVHPPLVVAEPVESQQNEGHVNGASTALEGEDGTTIKKNDVERNAGKEVLVEVPLKNLTEPAPDCFPECCYHRLTFLKADGDTAAGGCCKTLRQRCYTLTSHLAFEVVIFLVIIASFISLAVENPKTSPEDRKSFHTADVIFTTMFVVEMLLKWIGTGLKGYFSTHWGRLEFVVVLACLYCDIAFAFGLDNQRKFRIFRMLRIFWLPGRFQKLQVIQRTLISSVWKLISAALICLFTWLPFAILALHIYAGMFYRCVDNNYHLIGYHDGVNITNRSACLETNNTWHNPWKNFDEVQISYISLFFVATFKGWIETFNDVSDSVFEIDSQPRRDANVYGVSLLVIFIWFSSLFTLQLFLGILRESYDKESQAEENEGLVGNKLLLYRALKKAVSFKPRRIVPKPHNPILLWFYTLTTSLIFDFVILAVILVYCVARAFESADLAPDYHIVLFYVTLGTILIYMLEFTMKVMGLRTYYFRDPWNIFELLVLAVSIIDLVVAELSLLPFDVASLLRFLRVLKLWQLREEIHTPPSLKMVTSVMWCSLRHIAGVAFLQLLFLFGYAVLGVALLGDLELDLEYSLAGFESFGRAVLTLFPITTSAGWDTIFSSMPKWYSNYRLTQREVLYLVSFVFINVFIFLKLQVAVILTRYCQVREDLEEGLIEEDIVRFYHVWRQFNPNGSYYMPLEFVPQFLDSLEDPLKVPKPNETTITSMNLPIYKNNTVFCQDLLVASVRHFFSSKGTALDGVPDPQERFGTMKKERVFATAVGTTASSEITIV